MCVFTRRLECDPHGVVALRAHFGDEGHGTGVAVSLRVTRIRPSSRETERTDRGSQVLLTAGPSRQRAATADAFAATTSDPLSASAR